MCPDSTAARRDRLKPAPTDGQLVVAGCTRPRVVGAGFSRSRARSAGVPSFVPLSENMSMFLCPQCRQPLPVRPPCSCGFVLREFDGVINLMTDEEVAEIQPF